MELLQNTREFFTGGVPSYTAAFYGIKSGFEKCHKVCNESNSYHPLEFIDTLQKYAHVDWKRDLGLVIVFAALWTQLRYLVANLFSQPVARYFELKPVSAKKYPESQWKLVVYTFTFSFLCYVIFGIKKNSHIFYEPETIWDDYKVGMPVDAEIYYIYMLELSFYVHSIYASLVLDVWRKDSLVMMFHHFLTISLIGFSYATRYHKIGLLVLFTHDVTDVILEFIKCNVYFKDRGGRYYATHEMMANIGFLGFALGWFVFRLYWFPLKVLYSCGYASMARYETIIQLPFYFFFNGLLWVLQILNIWWFTFIINFIIRVATGRQTEVDDIRDEDVDARSTDTNVAKSNGSLSAKKAKTAKKKSVMKAD